ncbi:MAG: WecB/TagA/CpsF family glycosyltransferase [Thiobacillus sp.]|jgi:beta-1,4-glucosyltransferase|uniref:WecB/TagA/CpsF family glycosyltransferase n=1 Tax=Thiobacillus sp. TaxID=924 RepID=UPI0028956B30|nr:WecB/TagA/CpsF family glycosyltransferase [Thiobacillus sp.]MDT3706543.1 WecB/TagA/CpsF family glycosyltransferase [Thiobacillus sp.]
MRSISTIQVGGFSVLKITSSELASHLLEQRQSGKQITLFFANTNFVVQCRDMRNQMENEGIAIVNDGVGMDIAARLLHADCFKENLNGTDFMPFLFRRSSTPLRVFMVGGKPRVLQQAAQYVTQQLGQVVVGRCDGYDGIKTNPDLVETINQALADVVLVAMGNPIQEKWILDHRQGLHAGILAGVGALFDFWAGDKPRAPVFVQKMRLEWFYRLCLEPRRLVRRYTVDIVKFLNHCYHSR